MLVKIQVPDSVGFKSGSNVGKVMSLLSTDNKISFFFFWLQFENLVYFLLFIK